MNNKDNLVNAARYAELIEGINLNNQQARLTNTSANLQVSMSNKFKFKQQTALANTHR